MISSVGLTSLFLCCDYVKHFAFLYGFVQIANWGRLNLWVEVHWWVFTILSFSYRKPSQHNDDSDSHDTDKTHVRQSYIDYEYLYAYIKKGAHVQWSGGCSNKPWSVVRSVVTFQGFLGTRMAMYRTYSISQEICTRCLLCCALLWLYIDWFSHIHQAYFTGTVAIVKCQQSNPDEYG